MLAHTLARYEPELVQQLSADEPEKFLTTLRSVIYALGAAERARRQTKVLVAKLQQTAKECGESITSVVSFVTQSRFSEAFGTFSNYLQTVHSKQRSFVKAGVRTDWKRYRQKCRALACEQRLARQRAQRCQTLEQQLAEQRQVNVSLERALNDKHKIDLHAGLKATEERVTQLERRKADERVEKLLSENELLVKTLHGQLNSLRKEFAQSVEIARQSEKRTVYVQTLGDASKDHEDTKQAIELRRELDWTVKSHQTQLIELKHNFEKLLEKSMESKTAEIERMKQQREQDVNMFAVGRQDWDLEYGRVLKRLGQAHEELKEISAKHVEDRRQWSQSLNDVESKLSRAYVKIDKLQNEVTLAEQSHQGHLNENHAELETLKVKYKSLKRKFFSLHQEYDSLRARILLSDGEVGVLQELVRRSCEDRLRLQDVLLERSNAAETQDRAHGSKSEAKFAALSTLCTAASSVSDLSSLSLDSHFEKATHFPERGDCEDKSTPT